MRLEFLFSQARHVLPGKTQWDSRTALLSILDIQSVFTRSDIKTDILKELERLAVVLDQLGQNPNVDSSKLDALLAEIDAAIDAVHAMHGPVGQPLRGNELLNAVRQRSSIAGGTCDFDIPAYHYWLEQSYEERQHDLKTWFAYFEPILVAAQLVLSLIRESSPSSHERAHEGFFQRTLDTNTPCHMIRVTIPHSLPYYAEISGGKHRFAIRFMQMNLYERDTPSQESIDFLLSCCAL